MIARVLKMMFVQRTQHSFKNNVGSGMVFHVCKSGRHADVVQTGYGAP
jgi:hypothetical protein